MTENKIKNEMIIDSLNWRYATKAFDPSKKISNEDFHTLAESLRLSPSSYGLQPWKFIILQNPELRKKCREVSYGQSQITDCSHLVVITTNEKMTEVEVDAYISDISKTRGVPTEHLKGFRDMMVGDVVKGPRAKVIQQWSQRQGYIAMGFLLETAALLKIDTCAMEGIDAAQYDSLLGLQETPFRTVAVVALGYRSDSDQNATFKKVRAPKERIIEFRN